jgi:hypothetical protein
MKPLPNRKAVKPARVVLTDPLWKHLIEDIMGDSVAELAGRTGLPYLLIYNIVHKRIKSVSARHYRIIFGEAPPVQKHVKIDGTLFREMVDLWLFLNDDITKADLYREFYGSRHTKKVDYRIFSGHTLSIDPELVRFLERKFSDSGIDPETMHYWTREFAKRDRDAPVAYERVRPLLIFLNDALGVHPTAILNQWFQRYESGDLKHVSRRVYDKVLTLKKSAEKALATGSRLKVEKLKEEIYGRKPGYTLYAEVAEELRFLQKYARRSPKKYLGRSTSMYTKGQVKRLASWRADKIKADCQAFIRQKPHYALRLLPFSIRKTLIDAVINILKTRLADLLSREEGIAFEKQILRPEYASDEYKKQIYGFTQFEAAGKTLGMKKKAFDLMVARNCEIFRKIGTYSRRWYLSDLYLKELTKKQYFDLISVKYEWLSRKNDPAARADTCLN